MLMSNGRLHGLSGPNSIGRPDNQPVAISLDYHQWYSKTPNRCSFSTHTKALDSGYIRKEHMISKPHDFCDVFDQSKMVKLQFSKTHSLTNLPKIPRSGQDRETSNSRNRVNVWRYAWNLLSYRKGQTIFICYGKIKLCRPFPEFQNSFSPSSNSYH